MADCSAEGCSALQSYLPYQPSLDASAFMLAAFAVLAVANFINGILYQTPLFTAALLAGLVLEVLSYVGRLLLRNDPESRTSYDLYMFGSVLGPTCIGASICVALPHVLVMYSRRLRTSHRPAHLSIALLALFALTLVLEVVGLVLSVSGISAGQAVTGVRLLLTAFAVQLLGLSIFFGVYYWFMATTSSNRHLLDHKRADTYLSTKFKLFLLCLQIAAAFIVVRTIASIVQFAPGAGSPAVQTQVFSIVLDGVMVLLAALALSVMPPGAAFGRSWADTSPYKKESGTHTSPMAMQRSPRSPYFIQHLVAGPDSPGTQPATAQLSPRSLGHQDHVQTPTSARTFHSQGSNTSNHQYAAVPAPSQMQFQQPPRRPSRQAPPRAPPRPRASSQRQEIQHPVRGDAPRRPAAPTLVAQEDLW